MLGKPGVRLIQAQSSCRAKGCGRRPRFISPLHYRLGSLAGPRVSYILPINGCHRRCHRWKGGENREKLM